MCDVGTNEENCTDGVTQIESLEIQEACEIKKPLMKSARDKSPQNPKNVQRTTELERMILKRARESKREQILMKRRRVISAESMTEAGGCKRMSELRRS